MATEQDELMRTLSDVHGPALTRFVMRLTGDHAFSQDVVQESLLRAWRNGRILEQGETAARAWLYTVARNIVIDEWRTARNNREFATDELPEVPTPDRTDAVLDSWMLSEALLSLSIEHRTAVVGAYYLGHSVAEIARREDVPEGTVKSRLHYALRALRLALQERGITQ